MGFLDTKQKAAAYDNAKQVAQQNAVTQAELNAARNEGLAREAIAELMRRNPQVLYNEAPLGNAPTQAELGLAAQNMNPRGFANVPGSEMGAGYKMPSQGATNMQMYKRPVVQKPVQTSPGFVEAMGDGYIQ